jgi:hypothetical protein
MNAIANCQRWDVSFDEAFYLQTNPDVAAAVAAGMIPSGAVHFVNFGVKEGRIGKPGQLYDEATYLAKNPDVANAVSAGVFASGFEHLVLFGRREGRAFSPYFDEEWYRKRYPDVVGAIQAGAFASAFDHYLAFGRDPSERRSTSPLNEFIYLRRNPDVANAVDTNLFFSGQQHYEQNGRAEGRSVNITGTQGNDNLVASENGDVLTGVAVGVRQGRNPEPQAQSFSTYDSVGNGELDTLTGGAGPDFFILAGLFPSGGVGNLIAPWSFYIANDLALADQDYAEIRNFDPTQDRIMVSGAITVDIGNDTAIFSRRGPSPGDVDLVGRVIGVGADQLQGAFIDPFGGSSGILRG